MRRGSTGKIAENDDWEISPDAAAIAQAATRVGAFALPRASQDAVILASLSPGSYGAHVSSASATTAKGLALIEVYDAGDATALATAPRLANISTRGRVGAGDDVLVAGIVVTGDAPKRLLIRAIGPGLGGFGVTDTLADPVLRLYKADTVIEDVDDWIVSAELMTATTRVGAFPLPANSKDAATVVSLAPGSYTAQVSGARGSTGVALVEVYEVGDAP